MDWIKRHSIEIIFCLLLFGGMKTCTSCTKSRTIVWNQTQYERTYDSLQSVIYDKDAQLQSYQDTIWRLQQRIEALDKHIMLLSGSLDYSRKQNNSLVQTIKKQSDYNEKLN